MCLPPRGSSTHCPVSPLYDDVLELGAFSGLVYTPTLVVAYGGSRL